MCPLTSLRVAEGSFPTHDTKRPDDLAQLGQVSTNLVLNALDAMQTRAWVRHVPDEHQEIRIYILNKEHERSVATEIKRGHFWLTGE